LRGDPKEHATNVPSPWILTHQEGSSNCIAVIVRVHSRQFSKCMMCADEKALRRCERPPPSPRRLRQVRYVAIHAIRPDALSQGNQSPHATSSPRCANPAEDSVFHILREARPGRHQLRQIRVIPNCSTTGSTTPHPVRCAVAGLTRTYGFRGAGSIPAASNLSTCDHERQIATNTEVTNPPKNPARTPTDDKRPEKTVVGQTTGQTAGQIPIGASCSMDPDLELIVAVWTKPPKVIQAGVMAMTRAASGLG